MTLVMMCILIVIVIVIVVLHPPSRCARASRADVLFLSAH